MRWTNPNRLSWLGLVAVLLVTVGCGVPQVLSPALPEAAGTVGIGQTLSQPFLAPSDGLDGVTVAISPPLTPEGGLLPQPTGGATVAVRYAPEADDRFPEEGFHDWSTSDQWLGELTGERSFGQSFFSRYPGLNGITLRVANYGADIGIGLATIEQGPSVDVLAFPVDGDVIATLPGGSTVDVMGSAEGFAEISLGKTRTGYVRLGIFSRFTPPSRQNTHAVVLTLYRQSDMSIVRQSIIDASKLGDNSHVLFAFDPIPDSDGQTYRFVLTSPGSTAGNAVTFRYQPVSNYHEGSRYAGSKSVAGALVFRPDFKEGPPIYQANVDTLEWSSLNHAFIGRFAVMRDTADRFLSIDLSPGTRPLSVNWSLARPTGGQPMVVDGNSQTPGGGLVFNARFRGDLAISDIVSDAAHVVWNDMRSDPGFFTVYLIVLLALVGWCGWSGVRRVRHGR